MSFFVGISKRPVNLGVHASLPHLLSSKHLVKPIRNRLYGIGWRVYFPDHETDYFFDNIDPLQQEILAVEQRAKLRKRKQKNKGQKHDNKE